MTTEFTDENFHIYLQEGIVYIVFNKDFYDYEAVDIGVKKRLEICGDNTFPILTDLRKVKSATREARQRMAAKDGGIGVSAVAILINSNVQRIIYNFFSSIYKAPAPARLFTNREKALNWLQNFKTSED